MLTLTVFPSTGAIKFGDPLTLVECQSLIQQLSQCKLPFQCAHGRYPTSLMISYTCHNNTRVCHVVVQHNWLGCSISPQNLQCSVAHSDG